MPHSRTTIVKRKGKRNYNVAVGIPGSLENANNLREGASDDTGQKDYLKKKCKAKKGCKAKTQLGKNGKNIMYAKRSVYIGPRGGYYTIVNGKKRSLSKKQVTSSTYNYN
jgi:hypothetical protein